MGISFIISLNESRVCLQTMNNSDRNGPLSPNIIFVLVADEIIKADQTAQRKSYRCLTPQPPRPPLVLQWGRPSERFSQVNMLGL